MVLASSSRGEIDQADNSYCNVNRQAVQISLLNDEFLHVYSTRSAGGVPGGTAGGVYPHPGHRCVCQRGGRAGAPRPAGARARARGSARLRGRTMWQSGLAGSSHAQSSDRMPAGRPRLNLLATPCGNRSREAAMAFWIEVLHRGYFWELRHLHSAPFVRWWGSSHQRSAE